jgi:hypothetical protein
MIQCDELRGADEGEIQRIEKYPCVIAIAGFGEIQITNNFAVSQDGRCGEIGGLSANQYAHLIFPLLDVGVLVVVMLKHAGT